MFLWQTYTCYDKLRAVNPSQGSYNIYACFYDKLIHVMTNLGQLPQVKAHTTFILEHSKLLHVYMTNLYTLWQTYTHYDKLRAVTPSQGSYNIYLRI